MEPEVQAVQPAEMAHRAPQPDTAAILAAERERVQAVQMAANPFIASGRLSQDQVTAMVAEGLSAADAAQRMLSLMAAQETPVSRGAATIVRDERETRMEGMIGALMGDTEGPAAQFRGLRLRRLATELSGAGSRSFNEIEAIRRGMAATTMAGGAHGISDFSFITTEVMNRTLQRAYNRRAATWQAVCGPAMNATDFRELHSTRFGGDFQLKKVLENGEYEQATLADESEGLKVERRGRTITLTFEAVINDDMGAFQRIPTEFALAARTMESQMVWSLIRSNAAMKSGGNLFAAGKNNTVAAVAIDAASVGAARKRMWEQRAFGSKGTTSDDFLQIEPNLLIVPPALELTALQFVGATVPALDGSVNPYKSTLQAVVVPNIGAAAGGHDDRWYLVSSDLPPIAHAYLDGYAAPTVVTVEGMNPDAVVMNARHIFGAAPVESKGIQRIGQ